MKFSIRPMVPSELRAARWSWKGKGGGGNQQTSTTLVHAHIRAKGSEAGPATKPHAKREGPKEKGSLAQTDATGHRVGVRLQSALDKATRVVQQARGRGQEHVKQFGDEQGPLVRENARHVVPRTQQGIGEVCAGGVKKGGMVITEVSDTKSFLLD